MNHLWLLEEERGRGWQSRRAIASAVRHIMPSHQLFVAPSSSFALLLIIFSLDFSFRTSSPFFASHRCLECIALLPRVVLVVLPSAHAVAPPLPRVQQATPTGASV